MKKGIMFCMLLLWSAMTIAQVGKSKAKPSVTPGYELTNYQKKLMTTKAIFKAMLELKPNSNTVVPKKGFKFVKVSNQKGSLTFLVPNNTNNDDVKAFFGQRKDIPVDGRIVAMWCRCLNATGNGGGMPGQRRCYIHISGDESNDDGVPVFSCVDNGCGDCQKKQGELPKNPNDPPIVIFE